MELRIRSARTTKDIDLTLHDGTRLAKDPDERRKQVRAMLQDSAAIQLNDYFEFLVGEPRQELDEAPEGGIRYPVDARMDGRGLATGSAHLCFVPKTTHALHATDAAYTALPRRSVGG